MTFALLACGSSQACCFLGDHANVVKRPKPGPTRRLEDSIPAVLAGLQASNPAVLAYSIPAVLAGWPGGRRMGDWMEIGRRIGDWMKTAGQVE